MRELALLLTYTSFFALGVLSPFVLVLGYVWVDNFVPQEVSYGLLRGLPVSQVIAMGAIGAYLLLDRRSPPRPNLIMVLTVLMAAWITATNFWAVAPADAWTKWDWAFKNVLLSAFIPFFLRSRVQIEAFIQVYIGAALIHIMPVGIKTMISGGGYGNSLGILTDSNSGLAESSTLAAVSIMFIPLLLWLRKHSILMPAKLRTPLYTGLIVVCCAAAVGTYARTALIGFFVVGAGMWIRSRHKIGFTVLLGIAALAISVAVSDAWVSRISTIKDPTKESSANTRFLVWRWTLDFVQDNPLGGGFSSYVINRIEDVAEDGTVLSVQFGRAFHSIYFEVLGEHGWPGFILFVAIAATALLGLRSIMRRTRKGKAPGLEWCRDLAAALQTATLTLLVCGAFIGIAFQPMYWYLFALAAMLSQYLRRVLSAKPAARPRAEAPLAPAFGGAREAAGRIGRVQPG